jgi:phage baseplate assembly protein V
MDSRSIAKLFAPLKRRIMLLCSRAVVRMTDDSTKMQELQLASLEGELHDGVERYQNYGFTSCPHPGAEAMTVFIGGDRSHGIAVVVDDRRYRMKGMKHGEVAVYTDEGDVIHLKRNRTIQVSTLHLQVDAGEDIVMSTRRFSLQAAEQAAITSPDFAVRGFDGGAQARIDGALHTTGTIASDADVQAGSVSLRGHTHPENDNGGPTGAPVGG